MKFRNEQEIEGGWTRWINPIMRGYKVSCCDCGLVHDVQFKSVRVVSENNDGTWESKDLDLDKYRVVFRARRNAKSTGQARRYKPKLEQVDA